jgi:hypothetical protein
MQSAPSNTNAQEIDAWAVRNDFLRLKSESECLSFLSQTGLFSNELIKAPDCVVEWSELQRVQDSIRNYLVHPSMLQGERSDRRDEEGDFISSAVDRASRSRTEFHWDERQRKLQLVADDTLSAMLVSVLIDHLKGAKFKVCARPDCRKLFELTSSHRRKFCSQYCGHFESLRRFRRAHAPQTKARTIHPTACTADVR